ncbi:MAG: TonB-dependent receptor [Bacteroidales bacterium]|nr:TonB-dependent receptor [Bacteroidales bacterium]
MSRLRLSFWVMLFMVMTMPAMAQEVLSSIAGRAIVPTEMKWRDGQQVLDIPAYGAKIVLVAQGDTLRETASQTGNFSFKKLKPGPVHMDIAYQGFEPFSEDFELLPGENVVLVPFVKKTETLEAAVAKADKPVVTQHGDTLVYHAGALPMQEGDYALDLLRRFPGVEITDGQIVVTGKAVKRSYVNGALIFGLDPMAPMEYLKGDQVVSMSVYDEANPNDRMDQRVREKERVINIKTKDPIFGATDLQLRALAGADQLPREDGSPQLRYTAGANAHFFSELQQLQADIVTGNVGMRSSNINMIPGPLSHYVDNTDIKLGYNRYWQSALFGNGLQLSYSFGHQKTISRSHRLQEYFETAGTPERTIDNEDEVVGRVRKHQMQASFAYRTGKHFNITWNHDLQISRDQNSRSLSEQTVVAGSLPMLRTQSSCSESPSWTLQERASIGFVSPTGKQLPRLELSMQLGRNKLDAWDLDTLASSYAKRYLTKAGEGLSQSYSARVSQNIVNWNKRDPSNPMQNKFFQLNGEYDFSYTSQDKLQEAYDLYGTPEPLVNAANTFDFTFSSLKNSLQVSSTYYDTKGGANFSVMASLQLEAERIIDRERIPSYAPVKKVYYRLRPMLSMNYKGWSVSYSSFAQAPSVQQLRHRVDDTNPLSLTAGNPDLKQSVVHSITFSWHPSNMAGKHMLMWNANAGVQVRPIVNKTTFFRADTILEEYDNYAVKAGSQLLRWENAPYGLTFSTNLTETSQWGGAWKISTQLRPSLSYRFMPQYFGEILDNTTEWAPSLTVGGNVYPLRGVSLGLNADMGYIRAWNQSRSLDNRAVRGTIGLQAKADFLKIAFFSGNYSWNLYKDFSAPAMGSSVHRLNLSVGIGLLKDKSLKISLSGVDLLRGGTQYSVAVGASSITRTWTPVYGRYFLLDISYRFNNSGGQRMMTRGF